MRQTRMIEQLVKGCRLAAGSLDNKIGVQRTCCFDRLEDRDNTGRCQSNFV